MEPTGVRDEEDRGGAFAGKSVVLTGTFASMKRAAAEKLLRDAGAHVSGSVSAKTDLLVHGQDAGSKLTKARSLGVATMTEAEMLAILAGAPTSGVTAPDEKLAAVRAAIAEVDAAQTARFGLPIGRLLLTWLRLFAMRPDIHVVERRLGAPAPAGTLVRMHGQVPTWLLALSAEVGSLHFWWVFEEHKDEIEGVSEGYQGGRINLRGIEDWAWWEPGTGVFDFPIQAQEMFDQLQPEGSTLISFEPGQSATDATLAFSASSELQRRPLGTAEEYLTRGAKRGFTWYWPADDHEGAGHTARLFDESIPRDTPEAIIIAELIQRGLDEAHARAMVRWLGEDAVLLVPRKKLPKPAAKPAKPIANRGAAPASEPDDVAHLVVPPARPLQWGFPWSIDEAMPAAEREPIVAWLARCSDIRPSRGSFFLATPQTPLDAREAAWRAGSTIVELAELERERPPEEPSARLERLRAALARPHRHGYCEAVMLLSTWDEATLPKAIALAQSALSRWPLSMRYLPAQWNDRPELRALARLAWGTVEQTLARPDVENVEALHTPDLDGLRAHHDRLAGLRELKVWGSAGLDAAVLACPGLSGLEHLELELHGASGIDLGRLLAAPHLQRLKAISLQGYTLETRDLEALANATQLLERVRIQGARLRPTAGQALAALASRKRLVSLDLADNNLGPEGVTAMFAEGDFGTLGVLDLSGNKIGNEGAQAIARADLSALRWLSLRSTDRKGEIKSAGAKAIAQSPSLGRLGTLIVSGNPIGAKGVAAIVESACLRRLTSLGASFCGASLGAIVDACGRGEPVPLADIDLAFPDAPKCETAGWSKATFLRKVRALNVDAVHASEWAPLLACPHLGALEALTLGSSRSSEAAAAGALASATPPPSLRYLRLEGCRLTPEQAAAIACSPLGRRLHGIALMESCTPPETSRAFHEAGLRLIGSAVFDIPPSSGLASATSLREDV